MEQQQEQLMLVVAQSIPVRAANLDRLRGAADEGAHERIQVVDGADTLESVVGDHQRLLQALALADGYQPLAHAPDEEGGARGQGVGCGL